MTQDAAFALLQRAYSNPMAAAEQARAAGRKLVGLVGPTVPVELVWAAGLYPITLSGEPGATPISDDLMEKFFEPECRFVFEGLMSGGFGQLALMVVPRTSDQYNKLYLYLREVQRIGRGDALPPVALYDLLHTRTKRSRAYGLARTAELRDLLAKIAGRPVTDGDLRKAITETNAARRAMHQLNAQRRQRTNGISGVEALTALSAFRFLQPAQYARALEQLIAAPTRRTESRPRLLIKGFPLNHNRLHAAVDAAGGVVVAEDDWWGARAAGPLIREQGDPLEAIFDHYFLDVPGPRVEPPGERERWFEHAIDVGDIDGVIFYAPPFDDLSGWDTPGQRAMLARRGIASMTMRCDAGAPSIANHLTAELSAFVNELAVAREPANG